MGGGGDTNNFSSPTMPPVTGAFSRAPPPPPAFWGGSNGGGMMPCVGIALYNSRGEPLGGVATFFTVPSRDTHATSSTVSGVLGVLTGVDVGNDFLSGVI